MVKYTRKPRKTIKKKPAAKRTLTRKVNMLMTNAKATRPEKIRVIKFSQNVPIGQVLGNAEGAVVFDVTPQPTQGDQTGSGTAQRQGAQINLMSSHYNFMVGQQSANTFAVRMRFTWVMIKGAPYTTATLVSQFFNNMYTPNPFITVQEVRDANSNYNPDYFGTYKILKQRNVIIKADEIAGVQRSLSFSQGFKYNRGKGHSVRYNQNLSGDGNVFDGQILMIVQIDRGNSSNVSPNTTATGLYSSEISTGSLLSYNRTDYYYDT